MSQETQKVFPRMTCSLSNELLHDIDKICYEHRVNRSEFVREALTTYLKYFHAQAHKINTSNEESLVV
ncbi:MULTISPECIES: ribbon-helix-helix domain-containing protein [Oscillatoriales]|uniref:CopG-like domain-containing protein DNA-binding n=2 Tax=Oscillatoriales TaxID=1150 RepID=K9VR08_9CYAN|nr:MULTISPECIES: ribbon-helix-helix domain-containing protein [Oscillatoriales]AFZ10518.1 CopG-like domain-containing protein DNA-binding [Oscillatoria nigro-viridis PCC 7112]MBE9093302.1 ribbon-helix-helix protein, CopG family [Tychonema sp. LEGE 07203]